MKTGSNQSGFTLVELIIAMAIVGMTALMLTGTLRFGARVWDVTGNAGDNSDEIEKVQALLRRLLSQAYPLYVADTQKSSVGMFAGEGDWLEFYGPGLQQIGSLGIYRYSLRFDQIGNEGRLLLQWSPKNANDPVYSTVPNEVEVLSGVSAIRISYLKPATADVMPEWKTSWRRSEGMPAFVSIHVEFLDLRRYWPDLGIALMIDRDVGCMYDPVSRDCRGRQ